jgi:hypothetical protein
VRQLDKILVHNDFMPMCFEIATEGQRGGNVGHSLAPFWSQARGASQISGVCFGRKQPCAKGQERRDGADIVAKVSEWMRIAADDR